MNGNKIKQLLLKNRTVFSNMLGTFVVKGLALCLSLFTMPAYIRFFQNQTILGVWFTIVSVFNWVLFFDLGLGNGLRNKLPKALEEKNEIKIKELISTTYIVMVGLVMLFALVGMVIIPRLNWNTFFNVDATVVSNLTLMRCVYIVFFGMLLQFILRLVTSVLYAMQKSAIVDFLALISSACIVLALVLMPSSSLENNLYTMAVVNLIAMSLPYIVVSFWVYGKALKISFTDIKRFNKGDAGDITRIGITLFWLQIVFVAVSLANEFLISKFTSPDYVVEYQAYFKIFKAGGMIFSLALTPIWSAVTKAQAKCDYYWIKKTYKIFLSACLICLLIELAIVPVLQPLMNIWLGKESIIVSPTAGIVFALSGTMLVIHNVNTSIGNGISYFRIQLIWMTFAAMVFIPLSYIMVKVTGKWIGVVIANVIALIPYELLAPIYTMKKLNSEIEMHDYHVR